MEYEAGYTIPEPEPTPDPGAGGGTSYKDFKWCSEPGIMKVMRLAGIVLVILKIVVPLLLMIFGSIDFGKAVISSDDDAIKKASMAFVKRIIASLVIFFIPTIVGFVFNLMGGFDKDRANYVVCSDCIFKLNCNLENSGE